MKRFALPILSLACVASLSAAEVGLGFSMGSDSNEISVPVRLKGGIVLEPSLSVSRSNYHGSNGVNTGKYSSYLVGFGAYKHRELGQSMEFFYGASLKAGRAEQHGASDANIFIVEPGVGLEYQVTKKVSLGGKVGVDFQHNAACGNASQANYIDTTSALFVRLFY